MSPGRHVPRQMPRAASDSAPPEHRYWWSVVERARHDARAARHTWLTARCSDSAGVTFNNETQPGLIGRSIPSIDVTATSADDRDAQSTESTHGRQEVFFMRRAALAA